MALFDSKTALNHAIKYLADVAQKRAAGGEVSDRARSYNERKQKLLQEQFPTQYMPNVGRQVMMAGGVPDDIPPPPMGHNNPPESMSFEGLHPQLISQRMPTNVRATEDPTREMLLANVDAMKKNPRVFSHNINLIKDYGHLKDEEMQGSDEQTAENFINHMKDNLLFLHDAMHPELRERAKLWYDGANRFANNIANRHGVPLAASAATIAAMSPQKDWFQNASLAERLMDIHHSHHDTPYTRDMEMTANRIFGKGKYDSLLDAIRGKSYGEIEDPTEKAVWLRLFDETYHNPAYRQLSPEGNLGEFNTNEDGGRSRIAWGSLNEISKGISALLGGADRSLISELMGERHKIRNFYNNILAPNSPSDDVTVDTHAVAASLLRPLASNGIPVAHNFKNSPEAGFNAAKGDDDTGVQGTYPLYVEALRRAASERGTLPREMQSITWEAVRGLFPDTFKNESNLAAVDGIWSKYRAGEIDVNEARKQIFDLAGGINAPAWSVGQGLGPNEEAPNTSYEGKLPSSGVYGQSTGMEPRTGAAASGPFTGLEEKDIQGFERHRQLARASQQAYGPQNGLPQSFEKRNGRGREQDLGVPVAAVHAPTEDAIAQFGAAGISAPEMLELKPSAKAAMRFHQAIMDAKNSHSAGASVHAYDPNEYRNMRLFLTSDGSAGFALKGDDIVSVFNNRNGGLKNVSNSMLQLAIQQGGRKLDAFDTELPHIYSRNKFRVISRMPWNEEYKPEGWNHADYAKYNNGRPDVVFMAFDPKREDLYDGREGVKVSDYDAAVELQNKGVKRANKNLARLIKKARGGFVGYRDGGSVYEPHQRAEEQGYSIRGYHVTRGRKAEQISSAKRFDPYMAMSPGEEATFFWDNPNAANDWASHMIGEPSFNPEEMSSRGIDRAERHATAVMPVRIHPGKSTTIDWEEATGQKFYNNKKMAQIIRNARDLGFDTLRIKNMIEGEMPNAPRTPEEAQAYTPHDQIAVLNPHVVRSEFAEFDPQKFGRDDLGAARGGAIDGDELQKAARAGRNGDTILAHINPQEAALLKRMGGSGTINPHTGLPEFAANPGDIAGGGFGSGNVGGGSSPSYSGNGGMDSPSESGPGPGMGGGGGGNGGGFGGGGNGGGGRDFGNDGGGGMGIGIPSGAGAFGRPSGGVSSGLGFDPNSGSAAGEMAPITGGYRNMALGTNIGAEMLGKTLSGGSTENFSPVGSGISNFNIRGAAPQAGFGDAPSMAAGSDIGPNMTIGGSLGAAQVEAMRSGSGWSDQYDPTGVSRGIAMGQQLAQPTSAAREANIPQATGMFGQPSMGTTTFGTGIRSVGFPQQTGVQDPSQAAYAEQMAKTAREAYLAQNFPESPRLGDLAQPTPAAPFATRDRAGSMGSMPMGTTQYGSDMTAYSSQPARPITPTPFSGFSADVQRAMIPTRPDSAFGKTFADPTGAQTSEALQNMDIATNAVTMLNSPTFAGSLVRAFTPTPTPATPEQQAAIERMYRGSLSTGVPANFATLEGMAQRYGAPGATPLAHPGQTADAYLSAGPSASIGRQDMPVSRPSAVGAGTPLSAYEPSRATGAGSSVRSNFNNAFAEARARGADTFEWTNPLTGQRGVYTTKLARKQGGRVPSLDNPDDWIASTEKPRSVEKVSKPRKVAKVEGPAIVNRAVMLSSRKS